MRDPDLDLDERGVKMLLVLGLAVLVGALIYAFRSNASASYEEGFGDGWNEGARRGIQKALVVGMTLGCMSTRKEEEPKNDNE